ncbi:MAG: hypothetical protein WAW23_02520 [Candidatus Methanoperedens sp.]
MTKPDILTEEYIKKLNEIIELFKIEKEGQMYFQNFGTEHNKYYYNIVLSIIVIFIGISNAVLIAGTEFKNIALILIIITLFMIGYIMFTIRSSDKRSKDLIHEFYKYNIIICDIQSLKTLPYEVNLSKLIDKIKFRYHLSTPFVDEKYISETWFEEVMDCLNEINKEILEKEKFLKSTSIDIQRRAT